MYRVFIIIYDVRDFNVDGRTRRILQYRKMIRDVMIDNTSQILPNITLNL